MNILSDKYIFGESKENILKNYGDEININLTLQPSNKSFFGPEYYSFIISSIGVEPPITVNPVNVTLGEGAVQYEKSEYVKNLGYIIANVYVAISGNYTLKINYISIEDISHLLININETKTPIDCTCYKTFISNELKSSIVTTKVNLNKGKNIIKLFAKKDTSAPWVGNFIFSIDSSPYSVEFNANTCNIHFPAFKLPNGFVGGIGFEGGYLTANVTVPTTSIYTFNLIYIASKIPTSLDIDINRKWTGVTYAFPDSLFLLDPQVYSFDVNLTKGTNNIKFYSRNDKIGPWIGPISFSRKYFFKIITAKETSRTGTATLNNNLITNVGYGLGTISFNVTPPNSNDYNLIIQYMCKNTPKTAMLYINNEYIGTYIFSPITTENKYGFKIIKVNLKNTKNTILLC